MGTRSDIVTTLRGITERVNTTPLSGEPDNQHSAARRVLVILGGCALGFGFAIVLSMYLAHSAGAATLPTPPPASPAAVIAQSAGAATLPTPPPASPAAVIAQPAGALLANNRGVNGVITLAAPARSVVSVDTIAPVQTDLGAMTHVAGVEPSNLPTMVLDSAAPVTSVLSASPSSVESSGQSSFSDGLEPQGALRSHTSFEDRSASRGEGADHSAAIPSPPGVPTPTSLRLTPIAPSAPIQNVSSTTNGSHPFDGLPPTALLLPALLALSVVLANKRAPRLLFFLTSARPG